MDLADMMVQMAISILLSTVKNPAKKTGLKRAMLKVRNTINLQYAGDPDFDTPTQPQP